MDRDDQSGLERLYAELFGLSLDEVASTLRFHGVPTEGPISNDGGGRSLYFADSDGNLGELRDFF